MRAAEHVRENTAPGGIDPAWQAEAIIRNFVQARSGHDAANLRLLAEHEQVGQHIEVLTTPELSGRAETTLHFIENQEHIVFVADAPQRAQPFTAEMIVSTFAL